MRRRHSRRTRLSVYDNGAPARGPTSISKRTGALIVARPEVVDAGIKHTALQDCTEILALICRYGFPSRLEGRATRPDRVHGPEAPGPAALVLRRILQAERMYAVVHQTILPVAPAKGGAVKRSCLVALRQRPRCGARRPRRTWMRSLPSTGRSCVVSSRVAPRRPRTSAVPMECRNAVLPRE